MAYKIQFENGHTVEFESQPSDSDIEEAFAHTQKLSPKKEKADWGTALKTSFANLGNVADKSISTLAGSAAALFGDQKGAVEIEEGMREREAARNQWANPQGQELGFGGKLAGIPAGILAGGFSPVDTVDRLLQAGETTSDAITGGLIDAGGNAIGLIAPGFVKGGRLLQAGTGAAANAGQDVATKLAIQAVAETEKGKAQFQPTLEDAAVAAVAGGGFAALHPPQTKKPPTANKTVEAIRAAQEAKKASTEPLKAGEQGNLFGPEMDWRGNDTPVREPGSRNPYDVGGYVTKTKEGVETTLDPSVQRSLFDEELFPQDGPYMDQLKTQEVLDARQRALEEGVVAARKQDEAITDVSHRQMGPEDTTPSTGQFSLENFKKAPISSRGGLNRQRGALDPMFMKDGYRGLLKAVSKLTDRLNTDEVWQRGITRALGGEYLKNEDGTPMVMLHGTTRDIVGDIRATEQGIHLGTPGSAHHFVTNPSKTGSKATFSSDRVRRNGQIYPMVLKEGNYPKVEVDVGDWTPTRILQKDSPAERAIVDAVTAELIDKGHTPSQVEGLFNFVRNQTGTKARNQAWMDVLKRAGIDGFFYRNTAESPRSGKSFDIAGGYSGLSFKKGAMPFEHPYSFVTWDASKVKSVFDTHGVEPGSLGAYDVFKFGPGSEAGFRERFAKSGLGKKQGGAINLWQTPDSDSIVGRISRAFKEEGVDLIDQNLIPPNPELQSVIDTAKAEGPKGDGKFLKNFQSGSTSVAMKTRSPLLLAGSRIGQNALKMTDIHVRNYVMPAENAIRKLSKDDIQTLHEVMLEESRNREMFDKDVLAEHLNPDQLIAYDLIRKNQENELGIVNAARVEKGLEPIDAHEAYLASRWQGDFRRPVYTLLFNEDGTPKLNKKGEQEKKLSWYLAANTKKGLEWETKNLMKYAEENGIKNLAFDKTWDHQVHTSRNKTDLEVTYSTLIDLLGRDDPAVKATAELVEQAKAAEAYNAFGAKKHFEEKAGIRGFVGDRPWRDPKKEAVTAFEEQFQKSKNAYSWAFTQKAVDGITKLASDPDLVKMQPKNVAFLRDYAKTLMGMSETKLAKALDDSFRSTGISPKLIQQGVGNLKSYFILTKLGASVGNMVVNTLQTANIPSYLFQMVGAGYRGNPITSIATGMFGGIMMATAHYTPKTSRAMIPDGFLREAVDYAEANGVTARSIVDEAPVGSSKTITGKAVRAVGHTLSGPETLARSVAFMSYAKMLESSGKFTKEQWPQMFQLAEEYTNKSMVDYRQTEHAMIYGKGGTIGKALNVLQTYPMSFWNQYSFMAREAAKGNPWGLLTMLPTHYLLAGVAGIPAAEALDKLYKLVKDNLLSTETWAELNESPFWRDPKAWLIDQMGQGYYGKLSVDTGINWTSRLGAPGPESMVMAPGGAAVELFEQGLAVGKAALDPTNSTKWAQAGMKTVPVALQGLLEQSGAMKDHTYVVKPETGERVYQKNTDLAAREGQYSRSPEEEKIRDFGLRSQKEVMTRDMMYSIDREVKLGQQKASELPDRIYDAARRGDQQKANTLAALYMSISKDQNAGTTLEEALKRAAQAEYTTTEQKAASGIKESVNKAIAYARARKALESVK